jgi:hypothetical protein
MSVSLAISSFYITYVFLLTTGVITFIEALRSPVPQIRHIMNLETCISIVASYFYGLFIEEINKAQNLYNVKDDTKDNNNNIIDNITNKDSAIIKPLSVIPIEK